MAAPPKRRRANQRRQSTSAQPSSAGQVRIIAGRFKGRKLPVPVVEGLRPTGDRVRETLFNWLQGDIAGAHCLDLFAGSGALGFEALSRFAQSVTFVEPDKSANRHLADTCQLLEVPVVDELAPGVVIGSQAVNKPHATERPTHEPDNAISHLYLGTAEAAIDDWKRATNGPMFDVVFIDPPFQMGCQWAILQSLAPQLLVPKALIYLESPTAQSVPDSLPQGFELEREKRFGDVTVHLLAFNH